MKELALSWIQNLAITFMCIMCSAATALERSLSLDDIRGVESLVTMPPGAKPLANYNRFYTTESRNGREVILGVFLFDYPGLNVTPTVHIVEPKDMPLIADGGCTVVHLLYDVQAKRIVTVFCGGLG